MRVLVIGKAKTGTTVMASLIQDALHTAQLVMEPKSVIAFHASSMVSNDQVIKIIFEHFDKRYRHLNAIVHAEFGFPIDKVVFTMRDFRDEMISRLLYFSKSLRGPAATPAAWASWVERLKQKEESPSTISFWDLCEDFLRIFGVDVWANITSTCLRYSVQYEGFVKNSVTRDKFVIQYEEMIEGKMQGLSAYLGMPIGRAEDVDLRKFAYTKRSSSHGAWRSFLTDDDVVRLRPTIAAALKDKAYEDWDLTPVAWLDPAHYSQYVERMTSDKVD